MQLDVNVWWERGVGWDEMNICTIIFWRCTPPPNDRECVMINSIHTNSNYWSYASFFFHLLLSLFLTCIHSPHRHTSHCIRFVNCSWCSRVAMEGEWGERGGEDGRLDFPLRTWLKGLSLPTVNGMPRHPLSMIPRRCSHESMGWHLPGFCDA